MQARGTLIIACVWVEGSTSSQCSVLFESRQYWSRSLHLCQNMSPGSNRRGNHEVSITCCVQLAILLLNAMKV